MIGPHSFWFSRMTATCDVVPERLCVTPVCGVCMLSDCEHDFTSPSTRETEATKARAKLDPPISTITVAHRPDHRTTHAPTLQLYVKRWASRSRLVTPSGAVAHRPTVGAWLHGWLARSLWAAGSAVKRELT